jgi:hypothetical protein
VPVSVSHRRKALLAIAMLMVALLCIYFGFYVNRTQLTPAQSAQLAAEDAAVTALRTRSDSFFKFQSDGQRVRSSKEGEDWFVFIERVPAMPGGHTLVIIGPEGTVKRIIPGR